ncbi:hypothetical protein SAMN05428962_0692 [Paenibacillus sp. BC26]|nr:hypothetical protein SAMN05428962_0692 [Paenibacillus sp. BC26]
MSITEQDVLDYDRKTATVFVRNAYKQNVRT